MPKFKYNPPTRTHCTICEELAQQPIRPIIDSFSGKASSAALFPFHNWYYFVLGYSPQFPDFILSREKLNNQSLIVDPFAGTGTTLICAKIKGLMSAGVEANDYFIDVANTKLNWDIDVKAAQKLKDQIIKNAKKKFAGFISKHDTTLKIFLYEKDLYWEDYAQKNRPPMLTERYMSDIPFVKFSVLKSEIMRLVKNPDLLDFFELALSAIIVPISNVKYGPGFGVAKPKLDCDVITIFEKKIDRMLDDLTKLAEKPKVISKMIHGDARIISNYFKNNEVDLMITSPPYPGDHEYTKHTRLELILMDYAQNLSEFQVIKKRMIRGSTTNIYKEDVDIQWVEKFESIKNITSLIDERLTHDGATSGFEKLYTKLVWEYFGGMHRMLAETHKVLKKAGKISLLVSDSHAFKMVHIRTADILAEIGIDIGYRHATIELWQDKTTTSHQYHLRENILTLMK